MTARPDRSAHLDAATQVLVDDPAAPVLDDDALHHLSRVLRLRDGEVVCATDGAGSWCRTRFRGGAELEPDGAPGSEPRPEPQVTVAFVPVKGDRPDLVVQKLTEVGVDRIVVTSSARSVVRWAGERGDRHLERLQRISRESSQQCRRLWLPDVTRSPLADLLASGVVPADVGGRPIGGPGPGVVGVVVGPEGGWSDEERTDAAAAGAEPVGLGPHVLRAETAAIAAGVLLVEHRGHPPVAR